MTEELRANYQAIQEIPVAVVFSEERALESDLPESRADKVWLRALKVTDRYKRIIDEIAPISSVADVAIAYSVLNLLTSIVENDRLAHFHREVDRYAIRTKVEDLDLNQLGKDLSMISSNYSLSASEYTQEISTIIMDRYLFSRKIPSVILTPGWTKPEEVLKGSLYHFTDLVVFDKEEVVRIEMEPVYDGGIDSIAYPLYALKIKAAPGEPLSFDEFDRLTKDLSLSASLKLKFAEIVNWYVTDKDGFLKNRTWDKPFQHNEKADLTQLWSYLSSYINPIV